MQILDVLERFLLQLEADGRSPHTIGQYRRHVRLLARWAASEGLSGDLAELDHEDLARFLASPVVRERAQGGRRKATSANAIRSSVRAFFAYTAAAGFSPTNPAQLVRRAVCGPPPPRAVTAGEQERLLAVLRAATGAAAARDRMLVELMLATGIRLSSALALDAEDVDLDEGVMTLRRCKGDRTERVFLPHATRERLRAYLGERVVRPVFPGRDGERISPRHAQRRFRMWRRRAGIAVEVSPHALRHTFGMALYERTGDLLVVKEALGHRSISSTLSYARASTERIRSARSLSSYSEFSCASLRESPTCRRGR